MRLSPEQIATFYDQGYLTLENALTDADLAPLIEEYQGIIDERARRYFAAGRLTSLYEEESFDRRIMRLAAEVTEIVDELNPMYTRGRAAFEFLRHPKFLDIAESLVGPEIVCHPTQQLRPRIPDRVTGQHRYSGSYSGWHQDAGVLRPEADDHLLVTIWVPLTAATVDSGCLVVIPGSHKFGLRRHQSSPTPPPLFIPEEELPPLEPKPLPIAPGSLIVQHNYTCHASLPNVSDRVRWSFDFRYQDARKPTGHHYPGFVVRSQADPASVVQDHQRWAEMWRSALASGPARPAWRWQ